MISILSILSAALLISAADQKGQSWQTSYDLYEAAVADGDGADAAKYALEAWERATEELPPSGERALLAANAARLWVRPDPDKAIAPLEDAAALLEEGFDGHGLSKETLAFMLAEAQSATNRQNRRAARRAAEAAFALPEDDAGSPTLTSQRVRLSTTLMAERQWPLLIEVAGELSDDLSKFPSVDPATAIDIESLRAVALLRTQPDKRSGLGSSISSPSSLRRKRLSFAESLERSKWRFREVMRAMGSQPSIESFDPQFGRAMAWSALMNSFQLSYAPNRPEKAPPFEATAPTEAMAACTAEIPWKSRNLNYPALSAGYNGGVILGFNLTPDGEVTGARILGEIPEERFSRNVLRQAKRWEANVNGLDPVCLKDRVTVIEFTTRAG